MKGHQHISESARAFFRAMPTEKLLEWKSRYQELASGSYMQGRKNYKASQPHEMPWMVPVFERALLFVNQLIEQRENHDRERSKKTA